MLVSSPLRPSRPRGERADLGGFGIEPCRPAPSGSCRARLPKKSASPAGVNHLHHVNLLHAACASAWPRACEVHSLAGRSFVGPLRTRPLAAACVRFFWVVGLSRLRSLADGVAPRRFLPHLLGSALGGLACGEPFAPLRERPSVARSFDSRHSLSYGLLSLCNK
jgi:hypothetical protein